MLQESIQQYFRPAVSMKYPVVHKVHLYFVHYGIFNGKHWNTIGSMISWDGQMFIFDHINLK